MVITEEHLEASEPERIGLARRIVAELLDTSCRGGIAAFAGGSFLGPLATPTSDLDLVVLFEAVPAAWRDTLLVQGTTVEVFAHDPETFAYFCREVDGPSGAAPIAEMVVGGINLLPDGGTAAEVLDFARYFLDEGPPPLDGTALAVRRYEVATLLEDLADARSPDEALAVAAELYRGLADLALRGSGRWSGKGKQLARRLRRHDAALAERIDEALRLVARTEAGASAAFEAVAHQVLHPLGGPLFVGHRLEAPASWRVSLNPHRGEPPA